MDFSSSFSTRGFPSFLFIVFAVRSKKDEKEDSMVFGKRGTLPFLERAKCLRELSARPESSVFARSRLFLRSGDVERRKGSLLTDRPFLPII